MIFGVIELVVTKENKKWKNALILRFSLVEIEV